VAGGEQEGGQGQHGVARMSLSRTSYKRKRTDDNVCVLQTFSPAGQTGGQKEGQIWWCVLQIIYVASPPWANNLSIPAFWPSCLTISALPLLLPASSYNYIYLFYAFLPPLVAATLVACAHLRERDCPIPGCLPAPACRLPWTQTRLPYTYLRT